MIPMPSRTSSSPQEHVVKGVEWSAGVRAEQVDQEAVIRHGLLSRSKAINPFLPG